MRVLISIAGDGEPEECGECPAGPGMFRGWISNNVRNGGIFIDDDDVWIPLHRVRSVFTEDTDA